MPILNGQTVALAWRGRQGTRAVATSIFPLPALLKPLALRFQQKRES